MELNNSYKKYIILYIMNYGALGAVSPLLGQHLNLIGFTGTQIGTITSMGTFSAIFAIIFWGNAANGSKNKDIILALLCLFAAFFSILLMEIKMFVLFLIVYAIFYFFQQPISALSDAMTIGDGKPFNIVRMFGAIGYAMSVFVAGKFASDQDLSIIFVMSAIFFLLASCDVFLIDKEKKKKDILDEAGESAEEILKKYSKKDTKSYRTRFYKFFYFDEKKENKENERREKKNSRMRLLKNKRYIKYLICVFFIGGTNIANNVYFGFLYKESGGDIAGIGLAFLLMAGSEAPIMAICGKLSRKFGSEKIVFCSVIIAVIRFAWYGTSPHWTLLLGMFFLQGLVNGILLVELVNYVAKLVDVKDLSLAVSIYYVVSSSISAIVCQMIGGVLLDIYGSSGVYFFFGIFNLVGAVLYVIFGFYKENTLENQRI